MWVSGITFVQERMFVLQGQTVTVHRTTAGFPIMESKSIGGMEPSSRNDMTSCEQHHSLYISDILKNRILKIELDEHKRFNNCKVIPWPIKEGHGKPAGLSVTKDHTLLVTCFYGRKVLELDTEGNEKHVINLQSDIEWPMHSIKLSAERYIVCHGGDGVWIVDQFGKIQQLYEGLGPLGEESKDSELAWPCHLGLGSDGQVYIADHYNDRIVVLRHKEESLESERVIKMHRPRRLWFGNNTLYVGQKNGDLISLRLDTRDEH